MRSLSFLGAVCAVGLVIAGCGSSGANAPKPDAVTGVTLSISNSTLQIGGTSTLIASSTKGDATAAVGLDFVSSAPGIASVTSTGLVTAVSAGTATLTVTATGSGSCCTANVKTATASVTVTASVPALSGTLTVLPSPANVNVGSAVPLVPNPTKAAASVAVTIVYASSSSATATVDGNGVVTGVTPGQATVTVTATGSGAGFATTVQTAVVTINVAAQGTTTLPAFLSNVPTAASTSATASIVAAANAFIGTLTDVQKARTVFAASDATQRAKWSNFPTGIFQRNGVKIGELTDAQRAALLSMLSAAFSSRGYNKIINIVNADQALKNTSGGGGLTFGLAEYYVSFVGTPSTTTAWMLQFGGHHLAINFPVSNDTTRLGPSLTGVQPQSVTANGETVRPLGAETDKAYVLLNALSATQQTQAILPVRVSDLVLGPGQDGKTLAPEGIPGSALTASQQTLLLDLINEWVAINNDRNATYKMDRVRATIGSTYFAWSGSTAANSGAYFRITGPAIVLEWAPQGGSTDHIHAMYRDPTNEYGIAR